MTDHQDPQIIRSILVEQEERKRELLDPLGVVMGAVNRLKDREREVLISRFGLEDGKKVTLEAVGDKFQITRERVRQIETSAIKNLAATPAKDLNQLLKIINSYVVEAGGLVSVEEMVDYFKLGSDARLEAEVNAIRLVMSLDPQVVALPKSEHLRSGWMKKDFPLDTVLEALKVIHKFLEDAGRPQTIDELWASLTRHPNYSGDNAMLTVANLFGILNISSKVAKTADDKWGLTSWPTVTPKRIRDKVYLVLEKSGKPIHFRQIAEEINRQFGGKPVLSRTVHNELIGDKRFVLVGRGIYALKTWGYKPGVVADVIQRILQDAGGPLSSDAIITEVLRDRQVKRNTVVANLQNKALFKKVGKGLYSLVD